jgi:hypothetical protein
MRLSLHILYALAALAMVTAAMSLGAQQGLRMARPGGDAAAASPSAPATPAAEAPR